MSPFVVYQSKFFCPWLSLFRVAADQPNPNVVSLVHAPYRGAPGLPAAPPRNSQCPLPSTLQRTLQPRPQLCHGHAQVTACGLNATNGISRAKRKQEDSHVGRDDSSCVDNVINVATTYFWAPTASFGAGGGGVICQKLTVTANNTRNVQHLSHPVHRYSLKNVYINETCPKPQAQWGFLLSPELNWLTRNVQTIIHLGKILSCQS